MLFVAGLIGCPEAADEYVTAELIQQSISVQERLLEVMVKAPADYVR